MSDKSSEHKAQTAQTAQQHEPKHESVDQRLTTLEATVRRILERIGWQ